LVGLVPIRGWPHRVTRASNHFAGGDAFSVVKPSSVLYRGGGEKCSLWASSSARSAPSCSPALPTVFAVAGFCVTRPWCGPGGYIQVGMRGCESSGDPRAVRSVPPFMLRSYLENFYLLSRLPPSGGRDCMRRLGDGGLPALPCPAGVWFTLTDQGLRGAPGTRPRGVER